MAFYFAGDVHGENDIKKFNRANFPSGKNLTKDDYIFICGDFGLVWYEEGSKLSGYKTQNHWKKWLSEIFPNTKILVTLGNHENYDLVEKLPIIDMFDDKVRKVNEQIYLFERGHIYNIDGKKFLSLSGAMSIDKNWRLIQESSSTGKLWWEQELWTTTEENNCIDIIENNNWKVDYVVSHTAPDTIVNILFPDILKWSGKDTDPTARFFDFIYKKPLQFKKWYFGHWHVDRKYENFITCYDKIHKEDI